MQSRTESQLAELVRDALYERRAEHDGCFRYDPAAEELEACGATAPPVIECVILNDAEGKCTVYNRSRFDDFPGLLSVMRGYFMISDRFSLHKNAAAFIETISFGVRLDALDAIHRLVYRGKPLPNTLHGVLTKLLHQVTPTERRIVQQILERHKRRWWERPT